MSAEPVSEQITGTTRTVREVFGGSRRYGLDSYQREYALTEKQVEELINDLTGRFIKDWSPKHELKAVAHYQQYFLGPVITSLRKGSSYIIDGQQRLTTLMLLLMWLRRVQEGRDDAVGGLDPLATHPTGNAQTDKDNHVPAVFVAVVDPRQL